MYAAIEQWLASSRQKLADGQLTDADLDRLAELAQNPTQLVLYLYSKSTNMRSPLASWMLYNATRPQEPTLPSDTPPYASVLAAVADGWRIVQFPDPKQYPYEGTDNNYLSFEFILEKMVPGGAQ